MKNTVPQTVALILASLLLLGNTAVQADGLYIRIGDTGHGFKSHSSSHRTYGPITSFSHSYGPVTSFGSHHNQGPRYNHSLDRTHSGFDNSQQRFKSFHDRDRFLKNRGRHKSFGSGYKHGYREGFRDGQRQNRTLYYRWQR